MLGVLALVVYSVQWLGVVLGVGAETVLLSAHLAARHERKPEWLRHVPGVRGTLAIGLILIVASGVGAVWYQLLANQPQVLLIPTFGFKWLLIGAVSIIFFIERGLPGRAWIEGFAGATWYALFLVHSIAPVAGWGSLWVFYFGWLAVFGIGWSAFVLLMRAARPRAAVVLTQPVAAPKPIQHVVQAAKPVLSKRPVSISAPIAPAKPTTTASPIIVTSPALVAKPAASSQAAPYIPSVPVRELGHMRPQHPTNLPAVEYLELEPPHAPAAAAVAKTAAAAVATPQKTQETYEELPAIRVMPRSAEDAQKAALEFRAV